MSIVRDQLLSKYPTLPGCLPPCTATVSKLFEGNPPDRRSMTAMTQWAMSRIDDNGMSSHDLTAFLPELSLQTPMVSKALGVLDGSVCCPYWSKYAESAIAAFRSATGLTAELHGRKAYLINADSLGFGDAASCKASVAALMEFDRLCDVLCDGLDSVARLYTMSDCIICGGPVTYLWPNTPGFRVALDLDSFVPHALMIRFRAKQLWNELAHVPTDGAGHIDADWNGFDAGTSLEDIRDWFKQVMQYEPEDGSPHNPGIASGTATSPT